jgi:hypothetical protein
MAYRAFEHCEKNWLKTLKAFQSNFAKHVGTQQTPSKGKGASSGSIGGDLLALPHL